MTEEWLEDANGNRCSVSYFGSREAAQKALDSLVNCKNCVNCSYCSDCSYCSRCSGCSYCSNCSYCSCCSGCADCSHCSYCSYCSYCSRCSHCSYCSYCSDCSYCSGLDGENKEPVSPIVIPAIPSIHQKVYAAVSQPNALDMSSWHYCDSTHCRGGWVVTLAGAEGKALESRFNTELAAMLIYRASGYQINPCRFYDTADKAMEDMKQLAEAEAQDNQRGEK